MFFSVVFKMIVYSNSITFLQVSHMNNSCFISFYIISTIGDNFVLFFRTQLNGLKNFYQTRRSRGGVLVV